MSAVSIHILLLADVLANLLQVEPDRGNGIAPSPECSPENALRLLPVKAAYMFHSALIVPLHGIKWKTKLYRASYAVMGPALPLLYAVAPIRYDDGRAMLAVVKRGASASMLENSGVK